MQLFAFKHDDSVGVTVEETPSLLGAYNEEVHTYTENVKLVTVSKRTDSNLCPFRALSFKKHKG
jgi:hypothetical protein